MSNNSSVENLFPYKRPSTQSESEKDYQSPIIPYKDGSAVPNKSYEIDSNGRIIWVAPSTPKARSTAKNKKPDKMDILRAQLAEELSLRSDKVGKSKNINYENKLKTHKTVTRASTSSKYITKNGTSELSTDQILSSKLVSPVHQQSLEKSQNSVSQSFLQPLPLSTSPQPSDTRSKPSKSSKLTNSRPTPTLHRKKRNLEKARFHTINVQFPEVVRLDKTLHSAVLIDGSKKSTKSSSSIQQLIKSVHRSSSFSKVEEKSKFYPRYSPKPKRKSKAGSLSLTETLVSSINKTIIDNDSKTDNYSVNFSNKNGISKVETYKVEEKNSYQKNLAKFNLNQDRQVKSSKLFNMSHPTTPKTVDKFENNDFNKDSIEKYRQHIKSEILNYCHEIPDAQESAMKLEQDFSIERSNSNQYELEHFLNNCPSNQTNSEDDVFEIISLSEINQQSRYSRNNSILFEEPNFGNETEEIVEAYNKPGYEIVLTEVVVDYKEVEMNSEDHLGSRKPSSTNEREYQIEVYPNQDQFLNEGCVYNSNRDSGYFDNRDGLSGIPRINDKKKIVYSNSFQSNVSSDSIKTNEDSLGDLSEGRIFSEGVRAKDAKNNKTK